MVEDHFMHVKSIEGAQTLVLSDCRALLAQGKFHDDALLFEEAFFCSKVYRGTLVSLIGLLQSPTQFRLSFVGIAL
jgi:hypothetical protein